MPARTIQIGTSSPKGAQLKAIHHKPLELIADDEGSVTLGWVDAGVFYARFIGTLGAPLGEKHLERLRSALERTSTMHYFADARALASYEITARGVWIRTLQEYRNRLQSVVLLTWPQGITVHTEAMAAAIGGRVDIFSDELEFESRLLEIAPLARAKLDPNGWLLPTSLPRHPR
jgi:hypothetical protein